MEKLNFVMYVEYYYKKNDAFQIIPATGRRNKSSTTLTL